MAAKEKAEVRLYKNEYKTKDNHPDKTGSGEISRDALKKLVAKMKEDGGDSIEVDAAGWDRVSQKGTSYLYLTIEPKTKKDTGNGEDLPF
tara:strand:+ start:13370 stop:13639 length:270 start_codon:yes stop_codon:yes gene_type:complete